jgi:hypothetical protein
VSSVSINLTGVAVGDLLVVPVSGYYVRPWTVTDSSGANSWSSSPSVGTTPVCGFAWTVVQPGGGGSITITATNNATNYSAIGAVEYSVAPGASISAGAIVSATGTSAAPSSGPVAFSSSANYLLVGVASDWYQSWSGTGAASGFTARGKLNYSSNNYMSMLLEDQLNLTSSSSPLACTMALAASGNWAALGIAFQEVTPPVLPAQQIAYDRSGSRRRMWTD